ncbi:MAG TPA: hypothetical protein VMH83_09690, partial [Candidatus Acidoferrum sp.]|nr:hypothetical protein [Candidatus Acidoferrum sp.]
WSLALSLVLALSHVRVPQQILTIINPLAQMTSPLILIALGFHFSLNFTSLKLALQIVVVRVGVGLLVGSLLALGLENEALARTVIIACSAAPIGFTALTYSSLAKLDTNLSASAVSISILVGLIGIPILLLILGN